MRFTMNNISIYRLFKILVKNIVTIILVAVLCGVSAFVYFNYLAEKKYAATGSVMVTNGAILQGDASSGPVKGSDISASIYLLPTVKDILSSNDIYKMLADELGGKYSYWELKSFAKISSRDENSLFIDVRFETTDKSEAMLITNTFLKLVPEYITEFIPNSSSTRVTLADGAAKTYPSTLSYTVLAALAGATLCYAIVFLFSLNNATIETEEDLLSSYNLTVLGNVPDFNKSQSKKYAKYTYKKG